MRFLPLVGLAASASAFLVVPEVSKVEVESLPDDARDSWAVSLDVECPGCPVSMPHAGDITTELESHLHLDFEVDLEQANTLLLNGFQLYPHADPLAESLSAPHIVDFPEDREGMMRGGMMQSGSADMMNSVDVLGFTLLTLPTTIDDNKFEHVNIDFQIIEVGNVFVYSVPVLHISLVRDASGAIAIDKIVKGEPKGVAATATDGKEKPKCESWFCEWFESLESHWNHWRPHCGMGSKNRPQDSSLPHGQHHPHHGQDHPHHGHHTPQDPEEPPTSAYQSRPRTWGQLLQSVTTHILLPILIGIIAGVVMSTIGMLVGHFLVFMYRRFFRSSCPRRGVVLVAPIVSEEKSGLMEHQEPPPSYEEGAAAAGNVESKV